MRPMTPPLGLIDKFSMGGIPGVRAMATALPTSTVAMRLLAGLSSRGRCGSPSLILSMAVSNRLRLISGTSSRTCNHDRCYHSTAISSSNALLQISPAKKGLDLSAELGWIVRLTIAHSHLFSSIHLVRVASLRQLNVFLKLVHSV